MNSQAMVIDELIAARMKLDYRICMQVTRWRNSVSILLALVLCAKILLSCDPAFAMPKVAEAVSHCDLMGGAQKVPSAKQHFNPACMIGCPVIVMPFADVAQPAATYVVQHDISASNDLDGLQVAPATPPPRMG